MAQDILITPGSGEPQILFRGSGTTDTAVELNVLSSYQSGTGSGTALLFEGTEGQLFGITDNLSSGTIFSVADITGLPIIEADASGDVKLGEYGRYVGIGTGVPAYGLDVFSSGILRKGVILSNYVPATTTNALYNEGGTLKFNGSSIGGGGTSAEATYASGQAISNQSNITALLTASGTATSLISTSGIATYASGQAIENEGLATYASGQAISNQSNITALSTASGIATSLLSVSGTATSLVASSGIATYASGQAVANQSSATTNASNISTNTGNISTNTARVSYASGQAISNQSNITALNTASGVATSLLATSGTTTSLIATSGIASYASGQAISNQSNITALLSASGTATSLIASSGIASYASGQAVSNQSNITALNTASGIATSLLSVSGTATSLVASSGIATYASGNTANIAFGSNAEGDILYHNGTSFIRLAKGSNDTVLTMDGNVPNWEAAAGGSSLTAASGIVVDGADKINIYGGTGNLQEIQLTSDNIFTPKMIFTGSGVTDTPVTMKVLSSFGSVSTSGTALSFEGTQGQLFGITDNLSSGNIFTVNDITGLPLISASASGDVKLGEYGRYVGVGTGVPLYGFDVSSSGQFQKGFVLSSYVPATTTNTLYNEGGTLKFNGSAVGGGVSGDTFATDLKIGRDSQNLVDFATTDNKVIIRVNNINQVSLTDNVFGPEADSDVDLGTTSLRWKDVYVDSITVTGEIDGDSLDIEGDADINGTTNLDAVDIDGNVQIDGTVTVGVDDTGKDVKFFGATTGSYLEWDESEDRLNVVGAAYVNEAVPANDTPTTEDATITLDLKKGNYHNVVLGNNVTKFEFTNAKRGQRFLLRITQHASSAKTVAWTDVDYTTGGAAATVRWAGGGTAPTMSTSTSHTDVYGFLCTNNAGSAFDGFVIGQDLPD